ncbi:DegT/DnrJ/EryC1/StrS aminotransferase family protein [Polynucleobacter sp. CS-Odin-A6]|uniref:DegT/DnrJ/EryC1/StrS family aminotransferase n=1 Tax=Polynucleobacter sp. CS-Odin-A6 TaxID=2689106 RepID=UPI001C0DF97C|nr:DegT/DnrJ/EryC1/StrS family aminotransferase [Polynucleobacter sp. CS-Odin-A6]MBU3621122.1 DegT/DnrJ/EryC1/StrS family aminotransferase [Polynucleobacter sp. CS-Odin-A6]
MSQRKYLTFGSPQIMQEEKDLVMECLNSSWLGTGPRVAEFEKSFAHFKGVETALAVNSCTAALHISLIVANINPGDEVITSPLTFCATVNSIIHAGGIPVLADIDPVTFNIDPNQVINKITSKTKALIPVHFAGRPCEMDPLMEIAKKYDLKVIEDCAHAVEAEYKGKKIGTFGDFGCFSFYSTKNVVCGEGGMILSKKNEDHSRLKVLSLHGMSKDAWNRFGSDGFKHYQVTECGFKYNMMDIQAAIGIPQLQRLEKNWLRRGEIWDRYMNELQELPIKLPSKNDENTKHGLHLFTVRVNEKRSGISRDGFLDALHSKGIGCGVHYLSIPEHPYYQQKFKWHPDMWPNARDVGREVVSLPISPKLVDEDVDDVITAVRSIFNFK